MSLRFFDTRGLDDCRPTYSEVIIAGLADGGGLYLPEALPHLTLADIDALASLPSYAARATRVYDAFDIDFSHDEIAAIMREAYGSQFDDPAITPIRPLGDGRTHLLELFHGPTSAFKDLALQCMPRFFSAAIDRQRATGQMSRDMLILVATSGDTGSAALAGFADRPHTNIIVFYPADGISDVQRRQMTARPGANLGVFAVTGNFDDCQRAVKRAFENRGFATWLDLDEGLQFSSANSINWGRLMPQIVYYLSAVADLRRGGVLRDGGVVDICVPTGNFGNILGAWLAKQMGAPIGRLLCASNENNILADFLATGVYDTRGRAFRVTTSPSMDILVSSNLERLLYYMAGSERVQTWMSELAEDGVFSVGDEALKRLRGDFIGGWVSNEDTLTTLRETYEQYSYLADPHTAVALKMARDYLRSGGDEGGADNPMLVVSAAHWAKFAPNVTRALTGTPPGEDVDEPYGSMGGFDLTRAIHETLAPKASDVPANLCATEYAKERFRTVIESDEASVEAAVRQWLDSQN
ncbi:MAG: threonine synthase [Actinomycetes bacterium]|jgi:threonine synthase|nr:threonine synthase [Actinomycetes bacterium]